jgi:hypothetical protein
MRKTLRLALLSGLLGSTAAEAVTTTVSAVLDRPYVFPGPDDRFPDFYTDYLAAFPFNPGDTVDVTLTFPGGAPLDLGFLPSRITFTLFGGNGPTGTIYRSTATLSFINPVGAIRPVIGPQTTMVDRNAAVAFTNVRQTQRGPFSFDGLRVVMQLESSELPFSSEALPPIVFNAFSVAFVNDVPEPGTWAMLIAGFGLTGAMARRRRALA